MGDTTWDHQNKEWRITLELARSYGWDAPAKLGNHGGLLLKCPRRDSRHEVRIYSTGEGTETVAISARKKIRKCAHRDLTIPLGQIESGLTGAERLLTSAEQRLTADAAEARMERLAEDLELAEEQLSLVDEAFDAAAEERVTALAAVAPEDEGTEPSDLIDTAASKLRAVRLGLRDDLPAQHPDWERLQVRREEAAGRLAAVRQRVRAT